jgi:hypothetical protein
MKTRSIKIPVAVRIAVLVVCVVLPDCGRTESGLIDRDLWKAVVQVDSMLGERRMQSGSGFMLSKEIRRAHGTNRIRFVVTNKSLLGGCYSGDPKIPSVFNEFRINHFNPFGRHEMILKFVDTNCPPLKNEVLTHKNKNVDVALLPMLFLDEIERDFPQVVMPHVDISCLSGFVNSTNFGIAEEVVAIGFPIGVNATSGNDPVVQKGHLASIPGSQMDLFVRTGRQSGEIIEGRLRGAKMYLVAGFGGLLPSGLSGGPVFVARAAESKKEGLQDRVIGITAPSAAANMTIVFSSDYIVDLVNEFDKTIKDFKNGSIVLE